MLRGQDFGGREHRHLVSVLDGDHRRLRCHDGLAAAHVALQQTVHGARRGHVTRDLAQHALLRAGRLERQHGLDPLAHAIVQIEGDADLLPRFPAPRQQAAFQPEEFFEDQPELRGRAKRIQQPQIGVGRREVHFAYGGPAVQQLQVAGGCFRAM